MSAHIPLTFFFLVFPWLQLPQCLDAERELVCYACHDVRSGPCFNSDSLTSVVNCSLNERCYSLKAKLGQLAKMPMAERGCAFPENDVCQVLKPEDKRNVVECFTCHENYCNSSRGKTAGVVCLALFALLCFFSPLTDSTV